MTNGNGKNEEIMNLARGLVEAENTFNERYSMFMDAVNGTSPLTVINNIVTKGAAKKNGKKLPAGRRIRELLEASPGVRMSIEQIRNAVPDASPLTVRKTVFRLTHDVKGFKRDKKARGVYFFTG